MSEPKKSKSLSKKHIIDVEEPGKSAPTSTSKPVIVTNRPILKDPMVVEKTKENDKPDEVQLPAKPTKPTIQPLSAPALPEEKPAAKDKKPQDKPKKTEEPAPTAVIIEDQPADPGTDEAGPEEEAPEKPDEETADSAAGKIETDDSEPADNEPLDEEPAAGNEETKSPGSDKSATETDKKLAAEEAEEAKHATAVQKLIDGHKYELPINAVEKRKTKRFMILGIFLAIVLALAWTDVALDASLIQINGVKPVTHFFSN